ncbi:alpha/beta fold hydrolase [Mycolicibacterium farcinogenes]|uniref:alpha/beta fold hydrolase n=1 Tax=Mycolicibacterium farcinogenes TaxID=1802 RepID=UPI001FD3F5ED|nr:alpha/beta hydrolase [Mycolicibacterium farcinogenes]
MSVAVRGIHFHVTEAGPIDGKVILALHGWPQHHYAYRHLLADPPPGLRIIAPDLPGYGWSGPAPHRWAKEDVATDVLALLDALGINRVLLVGHDWGGWVGHLMALRAPDRVAAFLALNIAHPWQRPRAALRHIWRFAFYQPPIAGAGMFLHRYTPFLEKVIFRLNPAGLDSDEIGCYTDQFRDPVVARAATDTYRTWLVQELPALARRPERRRSHVPTRALFGVDDAAIRHELADPSTANADDYTLELVEHCGHFIAEQRPELIRTRLEELATNFA